MAVLYGQDPTADWIADAVHTQQRMHILATATELPSSARFDLANSPVSDDELVEVAQQFGSAPTTGYGFPELLHGLISREPQKVPVADIKTLQTTLINNGYLAPDYEPTGVYDAASHSAYRRADYDARQAQMHGGRWFTAPVYMATQALDMLNPSRLGQVLIGEAKGIIEQTPETFENLGALGGAAVGAGLGTLIAPGVGTLIGGAVGGVAGFVADMFGDDPEEEGAQPWYDPFVPQEYFTAKDKWHRVWEDVGLIATAASIVGGVGVAAKGVQGGIALARGAEAGMAAGLGATEAATAAARGAGLASGVSEAAGAVGATEGTAAVTLRGLMAAPEAAQSGIASRVVAGAVRKVSPNAGATLSEFFKTQGLIRQSSRPLLQMVNAGYTGAFTTALGTTMAQGLPGDQPTTIEQAIKNTPRLQTGVKLPLVGDLIDLPGFVLNPTQWLPVPGKLEGLGEALTKDFSKRSFAPIAEAIRGPGQRIGAAVDEGKAVLSEHNARAFGGDPIATANANYTDLVTPISTRILAEERVTARGTFYDEFGDYTATVAEEQRSIVKAMKAGDEQTLAETNRVLRLHEGAISATLAHEIGDTGSEQFGKYLEAKDIAREATRQYSDALGEDEIIGMVPLRSFETSDGLRASANEFLSKRQSYMAAKEVAGADGTVALQKMEYSKTVERLREQGLIPDEMAYRATTDEEPTDQIARWLEQRADGAPTEITEAFDADLVKELQDRGYMPVRMYDNGAGYSIPEIQDLSKGGLLEIGDYSRLRRFTDTIGVGWRPQTVRDAARWRFEKEELELRHALNDKGVGLKSTDVRQALNEVRDDLNKAQRRKYLWRYHPRDLSPEEIRDGLATKLGPGAIPDGFENDIAAAFKRGAAFGSDIMAGKAGLVDVGAAMRVNGLPGFSDFIRTMRQTDPDKGLKFANPMKKAALGAAVGAGLTVTQPDADGGDFLRAGLLGGVGGLGLHALSKKWAYGYLPDKLVKTATALRYTLSPTFDLGRYAEANTSALLKYELRPFLKPKNEVRRLARGGVNDFTGTQIHDPQAVEAFSNDLMNRIDDGFADWHMVEDLERRAFANGVVGFRPREFERAYALQMWKQGRSVSEIREALPQINGYGDVRTALEKSVNFVFFPFSFQKKVLTTVGDFISNAPGRGLMIHEGLRRYYQSNYDEKLHDLVANHLPALEALGNLNSFTFPFGIGPGNFFLSGIGDKRSIVGKLAQASSSIVVPSGAHSSLGNAVGIFGDQISDWVARMNDVKGGDPTIHAFVPLILTGEDMNRVGSGGIADALRSYIPLVRDMSYYFGMGDDDAAGGVFGQTFAALQQGGRTPFYQSQLYTDELRQFDTNLEPMAKAFGYASVDGFLASDFGQGFAQEREQKMLDLYEKYPSGAAMSEQFEGHAKTDARAIQDLREKGDYRTPEEDQLVRIHDTAEGMYETYSKLGVSSEQVKIMVQQEVRGMAMKFAGDRRFQELWDRFMSYDYGPIVRSA